MRWLWSPRAANETDEAFASFVRCRLEIDPPRPRSFHLLGFFAGWLGTSLVGVVLPEGGASSCGVGGRNVKLGFLSLLKMEEMREVKAVEGGGAMAGAGVVSGSAGVAVSDSDGCFVECEPKEKVLAKDSPKLVLVDVVVDDDLVDEVEKIREEEVFRNGTFRVFIPSFFDSSTVSETGSIFGEANCEEDVWSSLSGGIEVSGITCSEDKGGSREVEVSSTVGRFGELSTV